MLGKMACPFRLPSRPHQSDSHLQLLTETLLIRSLRNLISRLLAGVQRERKKSKGPDKEDWEIMLREVCFSSAELATWRRWEKPKVRIWSKPRKAARRKEVRGERRLQKRRQRRREKEGTKTEAPISFFLFYLLLFLSFPSWSFISSLIFPLWDLSNRISWTSSGTVKITHLLPIILYYIINFSFQDKGSRFLHFGQRSSSEQAISHTLVSKVRAKGDLAPCFKRHNRETLTHTPKYIHYSLTSHMGCIYVVIVLWSVPRQKLSTKQSYNSGESECRSPLLLPLSCIYKHFKMWLKWQWEENRINGKLWIGCWQENDVEMPRGR